MIIIAYRHPCWLKESCGIPKYQVEEKVRKMYIKEVKSEKPKKKKKVDKEKHHQLHQM